MTQIERDNNNSNPLENEETLFDTSCLQIGKYEILFYKVPDLDDNGQIILDENDEVGVHNSVLTLNGANVLIENLKYSITIDANKHPIAVNFTMPEDKSKLSDVFDKLPYGLIKKNRTGIGATTLELQAERDSIIVVPTRALAYEKAKNSKNENGLYQVYYVGGVIEDFIQPPLEDYLNDERIAHKKLITVIDSMYKLPEIIGKKLYTDFFFMVDEIDSYQYDSWYRPNMEKVVDYYFRFPLEKRCMVSATIGDFSNPEICEEPVVNVEFNTPSSRKIHLIHTRHPIGYAVNLIEKIYNDNPNEKILVALNLVTRGILPIIKSLPEHIQKECSVLCGGKSKIHVKEYYKEILDTHLPSRITFMSCTYFVGIDISERFHLVDIADVNYPFTLFSTDKLYQIAGRCRNNEGLLSEHIIYNTNSGYKLPKSLEQIKEDIIYDSNLLILLESNLKNVSHTFPRLIKKYQEIMVGEMVESSDKSYYGSSSIRLIREGKHNLVPAYFNIDNILIQIDLLSVLYTSSHTLKERLEIDGNIVEYVEDNQEFDIDEKILKEIALLKDENDISEREEIISELNDIEDLGLLKLKAQALRNEATNKNGIFLQHFIELIDFVPFDNLIQLLDEYDMPQKYKYLYNAIVFWALDDNHGIKEIIHNNFQIGRKMTGDEVTEIVNSIWNGILGLGNLSPRQAIPLAKEYFAILSRTTKRINHIPQPVYEVISSNPLCLTCHPVSKISKHTNIQRMLKL